MTERTSCGAHADGGNCRDPDTAFQPSAGRTGIGNSRHPRVPSDNKTNKEKIEMTPGPGMEGADNGKFPNPDILPLGRWGQLSQLV